MSKSQCISCWYSKNNFCSKLHTSISDLAVTDCKHFTKSKPLNKGLQKRQNKLQKNAAKTHTVAPEQVDICRFVFVEWTIIKNIKGKFKPYKDVGCHGLQIQNKIYLIDGRYKFVNSKNLKIKEVYNPIPYWATDELIEKYNQFQEKHN